MLYSTFYLGETQMGLPIPSILEIGRGFDFHPVRGAPEVIDGLINYEVKSSPLSTQAWLLKLKGFGIR